MGGSILLARLLVPWAIRGLPAFGQIVWRLVFSGLGFISACVSRFVFGFSDVASVALAVLLGPVLLLGLLLGLALAAGFHGLPFIYGNLKLIAFFGQQRKGVAKNAGAQNFYRATVGVVFFADFRAAFMKFFICLLLESQTAKQAATGARNFGRV